MQSLAAFVTTAIAAGRNGPAGSIPATPWTPRRSEVPPGKPTPRGLRDLDLRGHERIDDDDRLSTTRSGHEQGQRRPRLRRRSPAVAGVRIPVLANPDLSAPATVDPLIDAAMS